MISPWTNFSNTFLNNIWEDLDEKKVIPVDALKTGLVNHLFQHKKDNDLSLSNEMIKDIVSYALRKGKVKRKKNEITKLTDKAAKKVFKYYERVILSMHFSVECPGKLVRQNTKTPIKKAVERLSTVSSTLFVKYVEPDFKQKVKHLLSQVEEHQIEQKKIIPGATEFNFKNILTLEILAKKMAYLNPADGEKFNLFIDGRRITYQVENIHLWGNQKAFGLTALGCKDANPILIYSGTRFSLANPGTLETFIADFDPRGVGYLAYQLGRRNIKKWLTNLDKPAYITGHSLGGALSRYTAIDYPHLTKEIFTFSAPGIAPVYKRKWRQKKKDGIPRPLMVNFNHSEDRLPAFGQSHMGKNYQVICNIRKTVGKKLSAQRSIHSALLFDKVSLLCKTNPHKKVKVWLQRAIAIIPFIFAVIITTLMRLLFGTMTSYIALFGPLRWAWHKFVSDEENDHLFAPNEFQTV